MICTDESRQPEVADLHDEWLSVSGDGDEVGPLIGSVVVIRNPVYPGFCAHKGSVPS